MLSLYYKGIPKSHRYPCTKKTLKQYFGELDFGSVLYRTRYRHDRQFFKRIKIEGIIVASMQTCSNEKKFIISLYSVSKKLFTEKSVITFSENVLPKMHAWLLNILKSYPLGMTKYQEILVEFRGSDFLIHQLKPQ